MREVRSLVCDSVFTSSRKPEPCIGGGVKHAVPWTMVGRENRYSALNDTVTNLSSVLISISNALPTHRTVAQHKNPKGKSAVAAGRQVRVGSSF